MARIPIKRFRPIRPHEVDNETKDMIRQMLFGPYEDSWRNSNGIVENSDETIAKRLGLETSVVSFHTTSMTEKHFREVTYQRNNNPWVLPSELEMLKLKPQYKK